MLLAAVMALVVRLAGRGVPSMAAAWAGIERVLRARIVERVLMRVPRLACAASDSCLGLRLAGVAARAVLRRLDPRRVAAVSFGVTSPARLAVSHSRSPR
jgi:hypothetical protein